MSTVVRRIITAFAAVVAATLTVLPAQATTGHPGAHASAGASVPGLQPPPALPVNACHDSGLPRDYGTNFPTPPDPYGFGFANQTVIGWEGNYYAPFAYLSGAYFARGVPDHYKPGSTGLLRPDVLLRRLHLRAGRRPGARRRIGALVDGRRLSARHDHLVHPQRRGHHDHGFRRPAGHRGQPGRARLHAGTRQQSRTGRGGGPTGSVRVRAGLARPGARHRRARAERQPRLRRGRGHVRQRAGPAGADRAGSRRAPTSRVTAPPTRTWPGTGISGYPSPPRCRCRT